MEEEKSAEKMATTITLGEKAMGTIEASPEQRRTSEVIEAVKSGRFHVATEFTVPFLCFDGRPGAPLGPNTAGGSESLYVADALTSGDITGTGTTNQGYQRMLAYLQEKGLPIGGHTADAHHVPEGKSGCGANDNLAAIYGFIASEPTLLQDKAAQLGVNISGETMTHIIERIRATQEFSNGGELLASLRTAGGNEAAPVLHGEHKEVVALINKRAGTTLDRDALAGEFGPDYEVFNLDAWSWEAAARAISREDASQPEIDQKVAAITLYNLATAYVLCGPSMQVTTLE